VSPRKWRFRLEDIDDSLRMIFQYVEDMNFESFSEDRKTIDAVIRNIEIIGEAANHLPAEFKEQHEDIPWYQMQGMRNILIHEYFGVDIEVLWKTIQEDLPGVKNKIEKLLLRTKI